MNYYSLLQKQLLDNKTGQIFEACRISPILISAPKHLTICSNINICIYQYFEHLFGAEVHVAEMWQASKNLPSRHLSHLSDTYLRPEKMIQLIQQKMFSISPMVKHFGVEIGIAEMRQATKIWLYNIVLKQQSSLKAKQTFL